MMDEEIYNFAKKRKLLNCDESVIDYIYKNIDIPLIYGQIKSFLDLKMFTVRLIAKVAKIYHV